LKATRTRGAGDANIGRATGGNRTEPPVNDDTTPTLAERQMGEFLKTMPKNEGAKGSVVTGSGREPVKDTTPTLAERQMGIFLRSMPKAKGGAPYHRHGASPDPVTPTTMEGVVPAMESAGITYKQSSRAQKLATIPEPEFRERIAGRCSDA